MICEWCLRGMITTLDFCQYCRWFTAVVYIMHNMDKYKLLIFAYCLMDNHVHFIAIPQKKIHWQKFSAYLLCGILNILIIKKKASGHLRQGRFYSCVMDDNYLVAALRYVERNPVRAGILRKHWRWEWSSAGVHVGHGDGVINLENITSLIDTTAEE